MKTKRHRVLVDKPHVASLAALVSLSKVYGDMELKQWLSYRNQILDEQIASEGTPVCVYCGMRDLLKDPIPGVRRYPANLATIDHVMPVSKGGGKFDRDNCVVACYSCNQKKKDILPEDWSAANV